MDEDVLKPFEAWRIYNYAHPRVLLSFELAAQLFFACKQLRGYPRQRGSSSIKSPPPLGPCSSRPSALGQAAAYDSGYGRLGYSTCTRALHITTPLWRL